MSKMIHVFLSDFTGKVFKLLPMREEYDNNAENYLYDYLDGLISNLNGAFVCYPELSEERALVEVKNNLAYLSTEYVPYKKWRSVIFHSTSLISHLRDKYSAEENAK